MTHCHLLGTCPELESQINVTYMPHACFPLTKRSIYHYQETANNVLYSVPAILFVSYFRAETDFISGSL